MSDSPYVSATTPTIERANRLISIKSHPGFLDILRLSQELVDDAVRGCMAFGGWDPDQIIVLKVRMQAAHEHHEALLAKIHDAILAGVDEDRARVAAARAASAASALDKTAEEIIEQGDFVRQEVLTKFDEFDNRPAGSYAPAEDQVAEI